MAERIYKDWIKEYLRYSSLSEAPDTFHFWTAVSVLGGALRRKVWIDQGYFQWTPNFYIIFVAPPGIVSKSTTASIGMQLLKSLPDIKFGPDAVTWPALTQALAGSTVEEPHGDEYLPMSCITIVSSEFGTFLNPNDREMVDVLVSLWDGQLGTWEKVTKTQGSDLIVNPWINILAATTPSWIAGNFPDYMIGGGFTSRCMFVYGEEKRHLNAYPGGSLPDDFKELKANLIHDLELISMMIGEYKMEPDAIKWGEEWYAKHYETTAKGESGLDQNTFGGYFARKQTHIHKLAIILAASRRTKLVITKQDLIDAAKEVTTLEKTMPKVFALIGRSDDAKTVEVVHSFIQRVRVVEKTILYQELIHTLSVDEIKKSIEALVAANLVAVKQTGGKLLIIDRSHSKDAAIS